MVHGNNVLKFFPKVLKNENGDLISPLKIKKRRIVLFLENPVKRMKRVGDFF